MRLMHLPVKNKLSHVEGTAKNNDYQLRAVRQKIIAVVFCFLTAIHSGHLYQSSGCYNRARLRKQKNYSGWHLWLWTPFSCLKNSSNECQRFPFMCLSRDQQIKEITGVRNYNYCTIHKSVKKKFQEFQIINYIQLLQTYIHNITY